MAKKKPTKVKTITHTRDKRKNIPTEELLGFVDPDENSPKKMLYPRDPSLDPQLVWKGKDQQDGQDLEVPVVPVYIQEKIHPQAIVEDLRRRAGKAVSDPQMTFFDDFNGIEDFQQKIDFYHHDANWSNRMILGDSLLVMTSLAEKEGLKGKVQTIYIDPPYGIGFRSNWQVSMRKVDVKDRPQDLTRQPEQVRAFRDTWKLAIHSYLAYLRDRLVIARELLTNTGSVFVQIGDENIHLVRGILDEVFGPGNFEALVTFRKTNITFATGRLGGVCDYLLWYAKDSRLKKYRQLYIEKAIGGVGASNYGFVELITGERRRLTAAEKQNPGTIPQGGRVFSTENLMSSGATESCIYDIDFNGKTYSPVRGKSWKTHREGLLRLITAGRCVPLGDDRLYFVTYLDEYPITKLTNAWYDTRGEMDLTFVVQTNTEVVKRCMLMTTDPGDLVLDPTCGSGTTAYVAEQWGRRWITTDTSRVALALARTRLMAARYAYYLLADSSEGINKQAEITGKTPPLHETDNDIRKGFVYKRVPHITIGSIANNPDIKEGMDQEEIDASIARNADQELLYDRPYEDKKCVRVTGPFTVESLSPHRTISVEQKKTKTIEFEGVRHPRVCGPDQFGWMIIENLKKAGVQNRVKQERLKFDTLEPYAGEWIHAAGEYTKRDAPVPARDLPESPHPNPLPEGEGVQTGPLPEGEGVQTGPLPEGEGVRKRVAVCIGPEHGTVGPELLKEAAKEAVQGVGFDLLVVCGFAFDPHVDEEAKRYGKLEVLVCRMNPDLSMGDELLKKTGAGNLFMIFGEPDISIDRDDRGQVVVEIHGLDVYDPTTGQIRSESTDDIACWFIDTDYDGESFFVRHAYFTGADEPYDKLKRALRAEIDEAAWSALYSTRSQPFDRPETGKIAVKVINHYGDEVLKVYEVKSQ